MGNVKGFIKHKREDFKKIPVKKRTKSWKEIYEEMPVDILKTQASRCMDCGIPFCQSGCPINNIIPDWNDLVYKDDWFNAYKRLMKTNNFPEFTGRVCPAPCENACTLAINQQPVTIKNIEVRIIERAYEEGWVKAVVPKVRTGKKVAVIGSGPAGLACADQLNKARHIVTVFEKNEVIGGLLTLGIPEFKMEKHIVERRINLMRDEGIDFKTNANVGKNIDPLELKENFDAIVLCGGAENARNIPIEGRDLKGIHFAMEFLTEQNRINRGLKNVSDQKISAKGKKVIVLGGGDTGSDCVGTAIRQGAEKVINYELLSQPPKDRSSDNPWPQWAFVERISSSHEEGCDREFGILTKKFSGENGKIKKLHAVRVEWGEKDPETGRAQMKEIPGSEFEVDADLVLLALGFLGPVKNELFDKLGIELDERGNVKTGEDKMTNVPGIFSAGDMRRGQSLVVWAINEGRTAADSVNTFLEEN